MIIIEIKCTINVVNLNHSETNPPTLVCGKIVFHETRPCAKKAGAHLNEITLNGLFYFYSTIAKNE